MHALEREGAGPEAGMESPDIPSTTSGAVPALCPYLATVDGNWRSSTAVREHRCVAASPPVPLALEKQRRLCLVADHVTCATYGAAMAARPPPTPRMGSGRRAIARTTPVILDHGRFDLHLPAFAPDRISGQGLLVGVLLVAFLAILIARPTGNGGGAPAAAVLSPSAASGSTVPSASAAATAAGVSAPPSEAPVITARPIASPVPGVSGGPTASASGEPASSGRTYRVKSGDTLSAIAARFKTTINVLVDLNKIADPSRLRVGQVLLLP